MSERSERFIGKGRDRLAKRGGGVGGVASVREATQ